MIDRWPRARTFGRAALHTRTPGWALSRRAVLLAAVAGVAGSGALAGCRVIDDGVGAENLSGALNKEPAPGRSRTIEMYNQWGGRAGQAWVAMAQLYEEIQDEVAVRITYAPPTADTQVRLLTSIAAQSPPDVAFVLPEHYPQLTGLGVVTDLGPYLAADGLGAADFNPALWKAMNLTGTVYSMPAMVDPNFPLFYNRAVLADAGLDPDAPPVTLDELTAMSEAILQQQGGRITRIGTMPWNYYGYSNSLYTIGFAFGARFVSEDNERVTTESPEVVTALEWICDFAESMGGAGNVAVSQPGYSLPVLGTGNVGLMPMTAADASNLVQNSDIDLGSAPFPYAEGAGQPGSATWIGGWNMFIPSEAEDPDAAWDFIRWVTTTPEGTSESYEQMNNIPGLAQAPALDDLEADPVLGVFAEVLRDAQNVRPTIPVAGVLSQQLDIYVGQAVFGQLTAQQAMQRVSDTTNAAWDEFRETNGE
jgi:multiple sugar transport system substrate-binding protein